MKYEMYDRQLTCRYFCHLREWVVFFNHATNREPQVGTLVFRETHDEEFECLVDRAPPTKASALRPSSNPALSSRLGAGRPPALWHDLKAIESYDEHCLSVSAS